MRSLALALAPALALVGCISPGLVDEQPDSAVGWPTFLFQDDAGWCARGDGPWALWLRENAAFWGRTSGLTLARDGTLTLFSFPVEGAHLAGLSQDEAAGWLDEAGFARPDLDAGRLEAGRERAPDPDLASFCAMLAREGPFLPQRDDRRGCEDGGTIEFVVSTPMGGKRGRAYCGGETPEMAAFLEAVRDLREGARGRLGLTRS